MRYLKKVIVPVLLEDTASTYLRSLRDMDSLQHAEIQFIYVFNTMTYALDFGLAHLVFPIEADRKVIEQSANALLGSIATSVMTNEFKGKIVHHVLFSDDAKKAFTNYVQNEKPDLIIMPTKSKHGFFESSFTAYVNKHTDCNVLLLKHKD